MARTKFEIAIGDHIISEAIIDSDDYTLHEEIFLKAAKVLVEKGILTIEDFKEHGGWVRSVTSNYSYFVYRKNSVNIENRFYVNTRTKQLKNLLQRRPYQL